MNKKLLFLMVGMIVCLSIIGGALAVNYFKAPPANGTIAGDKVVKLSLGQSTPMNSITLEEGVAKNYDVVATVEKSSTAQANGTLVIALTNKSGEVLADNIQIDVYASADRTGVPSYSITGADDITIQNISATRTYYLSITLLDKPDESYTAEELALIGGNINISFTQTPQ